MLDFLGNAPGKARAEDKRAAPRRPLRCRVDLIGPNGRQIRGESFDLSTGGIGVMLDEQLRVGEVCRLMFAPFREGSTKSVSVTAKVAYSMLGRDGFRTGFEFQNVAAATASVINSLVSVPNALARQ